jgi:hypothetical protein
MVAHQAIRRHLKTGFVAGFGQGFEKILPVHIIPKEVLPPVAPAHDVVNGPSIFHSHFSRHGTNNAFSTDPPQANQTILRVDPFSADKKTLPG